MAGGPRAPAAGGTTGHRCSPPRPSTQQRPPRNGRVASRPPITSQAAPLLRGSALGLAPCGWRTDHQNGNAGHAWKGTRSSTAPRTARPRGVRRRPAVTARRIAPTGAAARPRTEADNRNRGLVAPEPAHPPTPTLTPSPHSLASRLRRRSVAAVHRRSRCRVVSSPTPVSTSRAGSCNLGARIATVCAMSAGGLVGRAGGAAHPRQPHTPGRLTASRLTGGWRGAGPGTRRGSAPPRAPRGRCVSTGTRRTRAGSREARRRRPAAARSAAGARRTHGPR
jgi:hypothetical protein